MRARHIAAWLAVMLATAAPAFADSEAAKEFGDKVSALGWVRGPAKVAVADVARIDLPKGPMFLGPEDTSKFLVLNGNPPASREYTVSAPDLSWFAIFAYDATGYIKDDDKIDAEALLKTLKEQDEEAAAERQRLKLTPFHLVGWFIEPHYDSATHNLEWGTRLADDKGNVTINYTSRILSRGGVMRTTLVSDPAHLAHDIAEFRKVQAGFDFNNGERYAEWKNGDKIAGYGLAALITGGAAAAAVKTGFFKTILVGLAAAWKLIAVAVVGAFAAVRKFLARLAGKGGGDD